MPEKHPGHIQSHINGFEKRLQQVNLQSLNTSAYSKTYLEHLLAHKKYYTAVYAQVLTLAVQKSTKDIADIILIDYGSGNGLLGLFAKYCGFKKVFLNDMDEHFINASSLLSKELNIHIDGFIHGDIKDVLTFFNSEKPDCIVGTDVIEHIYDLDAFFQTIHTIQPSIVSVFTTAANTYNPIKRRKLKALQRKDELFGGKPGDTILFGEEAHPSFLSMRTTIIHAYAPMLETDTVKKLAKATRGMNKKDIRKAIQDVEETGNFPDIMKHPTNTCNPETGSWTERLLSIDEYRLIYKNAGFILDIRYGKYDTYKTGIKSVVNHLLNTGVLMAGKFLAPYLILIGYQADFNESD